MNENDPLLARLIAGIRYGVKRYGGMADGLRGVPYEQGGTLAHRDHVHISFLAKPEPVLTPHEAALFRDARPE